MSYVFANFIFNVVNINIGIGGTRTLRRDPTDTIAGTFCIYARCMFQYNVNSLYLLHSCQNPCVRLLSLFYFAAIWFVLRHASAL